MDAVKNILSPFGFTSNAIQDTLVRQKRAVAGP